MSPEHNAVVKHSCIYRVNNNDDNNNNKSNYMGKFV